MAEEINNEEIINDEVSEETRDAESVQQANDLADKLFKARSVIEDQIHNAIVLLKNKETGEELFVREFTQTTELFTFFARRIVNKIAEDVVVEDPSVFAIKFKINYDSLEDLTSYTNSIYEFVKR